MEIKKRKKMDIRMLDALRNLNCSNQLDGAHSWGQLMNLLEDALDDDVDQARLTRRLTREGMADRAALLSEIESTLETRAAVLRVLLGQVRSLE